VKLPFDLPPIEKGGSPPVWTGNEFLLDGKPTKVLNYSSSELGWKKELTDFHEVTAGENHFIDRASRQVAIKQLDRNMNNKTTVLLEVGCSSGAMLRAIKKRFSSAIVIGSDCISEYLECLAFDLEGVPILQFDMVKCPFPDESIDAVIMLNVLEHIENDIEAVSQAYRILKPGGKLILEVPAGPSLYDAYDKYLLHYRRYRMNGLRKLVCRSGFEVLHRSHLGFFFYPVFRLIKKGNQGNLKASSREHKKIVTKEIQRTERNFLLSMVMNAEILLGRYVSYPFGIRCIMTCLKPQSSCSDSARRAPLVA